MTNKRTMEGTSARAPHSTFSDNKLHFISFDAPTSKWIKMIVIDYNYQLLKYSYNGHADVRQKFRRKNCTTNNDNEIKDSSSPSFVGEGVEK